MQRIKLGLSDLWDSKADWNLGERFADRTSLGIETSSQTGC